MQGAQMQSCSSQCWTAVQRAVWMEMTCQRQRTMVRKQTWTSVMSACGVQASFVRHQHPDLRSQPV